MSSDWRRWFGAERLGSLRSLARPAIVVGPVLIVAAGAAVYLATGDDDVTSLETEALQSSTLPLDESDPGIPQLADSSDQAASPGVESLGSPSTLKVDGSTPESTESTSGSSTTSTIISTTTISTTTSSTTASSATTASTTTSPATTALPTTGSSVLTTSAPVTTARPTTAPPTTATPTTQTPITLEVGPCRGSGEFERVFRDDFNGDVVSGSWRQYYSPGNDGYGLRRPSAITVENGRLVMTAQMVDGQLVSGGMAHRYDQKYGKYVFRVRVDADPDLATSAVVLTWPESEDWPRDGENNIYESLNYDVERNPFFTVIHKPFGAANDHIVHNHNADGTQFQTMTMEWRPDGITITREGPGFAGPIEQWVQPETDEDWIPDVAHHLTIQLDAWKDSISAPVRMEVEFAEVYQYCWG